jgi:exonuclease III
MYEENAMRLMIWNIWGGSRRGVVKAVKALEPDVAVLIDCRSTHADGLAAEAATIGYAHHLDNSPDYTGILMLSRWRLAAGEIQKSPIQHRWLHAVIPDLDLEIAALYGPLPKAIGSEPSMREFWDWIVPTCDRLIDRRAVVSGDFNTGVSHVDGPSDYRFSSATQLRELGTRGWRDAYRELYPDGRDVSWWHGERGFRIDHCLLSKAMPKPISVSYVVEHDGIRLAQTPSGSAHVSPAPSDHAALMADWG